MNGIEKLSYCAARNRKTKTMAKPKTMIAMIAGFELLIGDAGPFDRRSPPAGRVAATRCIAAIAWLEL